MRTFETRFRFTALMLTVLAACGDDGQPPPADAPPGPGGIDASAIDADPGAPDATPTGPDATPGAPDASPMGAVGIVDCRVDSDCPGAMTSCTRSAPGGICVTCGDINDCPSDTDCSNVILPPTCIRACNNDCDCNLGKRRSPGGRCLLRSCNDGNPWPSPYACIGSFCRRPDCGAGDACPSPLVCNNTVCVEP